MYAYLRDMYLILSCMQNLPYTLADPLCCSWQFFALFSSRFQCFSTFFFRPLREESFPSAMESFPCERVFLQLRSVRKRAEANTFLTSKSWHADLSGAALSLARSVPTFPQTPVITIPRVIAFTFSSSKELCSLWVLTIPFSVHEAPLGVLNGRLILGTQLLGFGAHVVAFLWFRASAIRVWCFRALSPVDNKTDTKRERQKRRHRERV